jgi:hypothetical protein
LCLGALKTTFLSVQKLLAACRADVARLYMADQEIAATFLPVDERRRQ